MFQKWKYKVIVVLITCYLQITTSAELFDSAFYNSQNLPQLTPNNVVPKPFKGDYIGCNRYIKMTPGTSVIITSPNFPGNYPPATYCLRTLVNTNVATTNSFLVLKCSSDFHLESVPSSVSCTYADYLRIWETDAKQSQYYCGTLGPPVIRTKSRTLNVGFYSDFNYGLSGFWCNVSASSLDQGYSPGENGINDGSQISDYCFTCGLTSINAEKTTYDDHTIVDHEFPWLSILRHKINTKDMCGGTLISKNFVLTSASCVKMKYKDNYELFFGMRAERPVEDNATTAGIQNIILHPEFHVTTLLHNIALVEIFPAFVTFTKSILPICLPNAKSKINHRIGIIAGWQSFPWGPDQKQLMKKTVVTILDFPRCNELIPYIQVTESTVCGWNLQKGTCHASSDSGGPMIVKEGDRHYVYGIASYVRDCTPGGPQPAMFTKVSVYLDWIQEETQLCSN